MSEKQVHVSRRVLLKQSACAVAALSATAMITKPAAARDERGHLPKRIAGVRIPDSRLARASSDYAFSVSPETLYNHCVRTYVFAALTFRQQNVRFDEEQLFVGSVLHDLGLVDQFMSETGRFEIDGADAAIDFLKRNGAPRLFCDVVWDGIAVHSFSGYAVRKAPEIAGISIGSGVDVVGWGLSDLDPADVAEVIAALPRLEFKRSVIETTLHLCEKKPQGVALTSFAELGRKYLPDFSAPTLEDLTLAAPFDE